MLDLGTVWQVILGLIVLLALSVFIGLVIRHFWVVAEPNEALLISGTKSKTGTFHIVIGRGKLVRPFFQRVRKLSLKLREAQLAVQCYTHQGIPVGVEGVCIYKIGNSEAEIQNAAQRFWGQDDATMDRNMQTLFDGHSRGIIGSMVFEEIVQDPESLAEKVRTSVSPEVNKLGLIIDSLQINKIIDPTHYIDKMAAPHVAAVEQRARVAKANEDKTATLAEQQVAAANAQAKRDTAVKVATLNSEIAAENERAAQAGPLAAALAKQEVLKQETEIQKLDALKKEQELYVTVRKPAEAEAAAAAARADGVKRALILQAEAEAQRTKLSAEAEGAKIKIAAEAQSYAVIQKGNGDKLSTVAAAEAAAARTELAATADANAIKLTGEATAASKWAIGEAEGKATRATLMAEADGLRAKGEAMSVNSDVVIQQAIAQQLPAMVREAAAPLGNIKDLVVLNGADGLTNNITGIVTQVMALWPKVREGIAKRSA